ncbi:MAG: GNAT family N-acetyltransferase [Saprospiraceae bacterium]
MNMLHQKVEIRWATLRDAAIIVELGRQTFTETFGHLFTPTALRDYLDATFNNIKICNSLQKAQNQYFIAYFENKAVGYSKIKINSKTPEIQAECPVQLQKLYVLQNFIAYKIGAALMQFCLQLPEIQSNDLMWLVVLQSNERAIRFYEKFGFIKYSEYAHQIGENRFEYYIMTKNLP